MLKLTTDSARPLRHLNFLSMTLKAWIIPGPCLCSQRRLPASLNYALRPITHQRKAVQLVLEQPCKHSSKPKILIDRMSPKLQEPKLGKYKMQSGEGEQDGMWRGGMWQIAHRPQSCTAPHFVLAPHYLRCEFLAHPEFLDPSLTRPAVLPRPDKFPIVTSPYSIYRKSVGFIMLCRCCVSGYCGFGFWNRDEVEIAICAWFSSNLSFC